MFALIYVYIITYISFLCKTGDVTSITNLCIAMLLILLYHMTIIV